MRVLHVIAGAKEGGSETLMLDAVRALGDAGVDQHVIAREDFTTAADALANTGIPVKFAAFDKTWREPTKALIRATSAKFRADVVQYWLGRSALFAPKHLRRMSVGCHGGFHKLARFKNCDWHMAASPLIAERIITEGAPEDRVVVIPPTIDAPSTNCADRASLTTPNDAHVLLALSRQHRKKSLQRLILALKRLPGVYLWALGEGAADPDTRELVDKLGLGDRVRLLTATNNRAALIAACDAVVLPARVEHFGKIAAEAWAARKPLLVSEPAGAAIGARDDIDALFLADENGELLVERLRQVIEDGELVRRLVDNGARAYETRYAKPAFIRASMAFYERVRAKQREFANKSAA